MQMSVFFIEYSNSLNTGFPARENEVKIVRSKFLILRYGVKAKWTSSTSSSLALQFLCQSVYTHPPVFTLTSFAEAHSWTSWTFFWAPDGWNLLRDSPPRDYSHLVSQTKWKWSGGFQFCVLTNELALVIKGPRILIAAIQWDSNLLLQKWKKLLIQESYTKSWWYFKWVHWECFVLTHPPSTNHSQNHLWPVKFWSVPLQQEVRVIVAFTVWLLVKIMKTVFHE